MLNSRVPVAVFVGPSGARAASAGFITVVADVAAMRLGTNIGAAPGLGMGGTMDEVMSKKSPRRRRLHPQQGGAPRPQRGARVRRWQSKSFTEREALDGHLIDLVVNDVPALIAAVEAARSRLDGTKVTLHVAGQPSRPV